MLFRYGVDKRFELRVEGNGYQSSTGEHHWTPFSAGFKIHLADAPSLGVIGRVFQHGTADLRLAADMNAGDKWSINPNLGVVSQKDETRFTAVTAALTVQYNFSERVNAFVDSGYQSKESAGGGTSLLVDVGGAWTVESDTQLDVSVAWGPRGSTTFFASAGLSHRF